MNIFLLDLDFDLNAQYHVDRHVVKMPTEAVQLLSTAYRITEGEPTELYELALDGTPIPKKNFYVVDIDDIVVKRGKLYLTNKIAMTATHINHPCNIWARESKQNWLWLREYALALNKEWKYRYGHLNNHISINRLIQIPIPNLPDIGLTPFVQAMPEQYRNEDPIKAYRSYYKEEKKHLLSYKRRKKPNWLEERNES